MNNTITKILEVNIKGQLAGSDIGGGICIAGSPGIGKTQTMYAIAKKLNMGILQASIPEISTEELSGIPSFMEAKHMDKYSTTGTVNSEATKWSVPQLIETANRLANENNGCILFIDDLHRVNMAVAPYLYGLLGERKLGSFRLDPKVAIMGAMNDSDEAGFSGIDSPIKDRLGILPVPFDFDHWFSNFGRNLHFYISSFLKVHPTYAQEDESTMIEQFATPRSWTHLANEFELYDREFIQENTALLSKQKVSKAAANELAKHVAYVEAIDFSDKVAKRAMIDISDERPIDQILYAYIINYIETIEDGRYICELIDKNIEVSNFIGFVVGEIYNKYLQQKAGKKVHPGLIMVIEKILGLSYSESMYLKPLTKKELEAYEETVLKNRTRLLSTAAEFIY